MDPKCGILSDSIPMLDLMSTCGTSTLKNWYGRTQSARGNGTGLSRAVAAMPGVHISCCGHRERERTTTETRTTTPKTKSMSKPAMVVDKNYDFPRGMSYL